MEWGKRRGRGKRTDRGGGEEGKRRDRKELSHLWGSVTDIPAAQTEHCFL